MHRSKEPGKRRRDWAGTAGRAALLGGLAAMVGGGAWALPIGPSAQTSNATAPTYVGDPSTGISGVNLTAPRTIIDWSAFNIAPGETVTFNAQARSDIVLNRLPDLQPVQINGTLKSLVGSQTGGNVWFSSPAGVIFGPNAVVDVGGLLATTSTLTDDFLDTTKSSFNFQFFGEGSFDPAGTSSSPYYGGVVVQSGARLATHKGLLALVAPFVTVQPGATVGDANTGDVLIGGVSGYTITLGQETAGDLDLLEFQIPVAYGGSDTAGGDTPVAPAITVDGTVAGKNVYVAALSLQSLTNAIVTDNGSISATGAVQQGDGTVILTADTIDLLPASFPNGAIYDPASGIAPAGGANLFLPQPATPLSFGAIDAPQTYIHAGGRVQGAAGTSITGGGAAVSGGDIALAGVNLTGALRAVAEPLPPAQYVQATPPEGILSASADITANDIALQASGSVFVGALSATGGPLTVTSDAGTISMGASSAAADLTVKAPGGGIEAFSLSAGGALDVTAGGAPDSQSFNGYLFAGDLTAGGALSVNAYTISAGAVTGRSVNLTAGSGGDGIALGDVEATSGPLTLAAASGDITATSATAAGAVTLTSSAGAVSVGTQPISDTEQPTAFTPGPVTEQGVTISGNTGVSVGDVTATQAFVQAADGSVAITSADIGSGGLEAHALGPNGDIWLGYASVPGTPSAPLAQVPLGAAASGGGTGALTGSAALYADGDVNLDVAGSANLAVVKAAGKASLTAETGDLTAASVTVGGLLSAAAPQGSIALGVTPASLVGSASAGRDLTITGLGALDLTGFGLLAGRDLALSSPGQLTVPGLSVSGDLTLSGAGIQAGSGLSAGRDATLSAPGLVSIADLTAADAVRVTAGDLALRGALTAPTVAIASASGPLTLGGGGAGTGLVLDASEFGRIRASAALDLYAGAASGAARGDLTVQDLAIDPARVPALDLYAAAGQTVSIAGLLAPTGSGGAVTIGGPAGWTPTSILVSGGLGAAMRISDTRFSGVRAFDQVSLNALGDILLGSSRFIGLVQAATPGQINLVLNLPAGAQPQGSEIGRVYLASGRLAVAAGGKVVGQNTSGGAGGYSGLYLANGPGVPGLVLTLDPPSVVDLFGSYVNKAGVTSSGPAAALGPELKVLAGSPLNDRFNGCVIGLGCGGGGSAVPSVVQGLQPLNGLQAVFVSQATDAAEAAGESDGADAAASPGARIQAPTFSVLPSADADAQADPVVTGTGNEEIWRKRVGDTR